MYYQNILKTVNNLRRENILCDVRILAGRQEIHAHRCVLIAGSEFFISSRVGEYCNEKESVVDLSSVTNDAVLMEAIVNFLYLGEINIDMDNLETIVKVGSFLSIGDVKNFCCKFMLHTLDVASSLTYYLLAREFLFPEVEGKALSVLKSRFHDAIIFQDIAQTIPPAELQNLLKRYDIFKHCSVSDTLEYTTNWVKLGGTEKHGKTGCDILEYVNSKIVGKEKVETACRHLSTKLQSEMVESEFVKKLKEVICFIESQYIEKEAEDNICTISPKAEPDDTGDIPSDTESQYLKEDENRMKTSHLDCTSIEESTASLLDRGIIKTEAESSVSSPAKEELYLETTENSGKAVNLKKESKKKSCRLCGRQFNLLSNLIKHMATHSTERPHSCKICSKKYKTKESFKYHMFRHSGKKMHCCSICKKRFYTKQLLTSHIAVHSGSKAHACNVCGSAFSHKSNLTTHLKKHSQIKMERDSQKLYFCSECNKQLNSKQGLTQHMVSHTGIKAYKCEICTKAFAHRAYMITHMKAHFGHQYTCSQCSKTFNYLSNLHKHKATHSADRPLYACAMCEKRYTTNESLKSHVRTHLGEKPYSCSLCQKRFTCRNGLKVHMLFHAGEKRHICSICGYACVLAGQLKAHMIKHTSEKTHRCEICQKLFKSKKVLKEHIQRHSLKKSFICETCGAQYKYRSTLEAHVNIHTGLVSYQCKICSQTFRWKASLSSHLATHTEERNHICSTCGKQFRRESNLKTHINIHTREKVYCCKECGRQFYDRSAFIRHSFIHSGEKRFTCTLCEKHFTRLENLRGHMKRFHPSA